MTENTLLQLCILKAASLLKEGLWPENPDEDFYDGNPFSSLSPHIVEQLIETVIQITPSGSLSMRDLYPLLTSGRVKHFKLEDVLLPSEELVGIFMALSISAHSLTSIVIRNVYCSEFRSIYLDTKQFAKNSALDCLLSVSPNLEVLETNIEFDLKGVRKTGSLKRLKINFVPKDPLTDILYEYNGTMYVNNALTHLSVFEDPRHTIPVTEMGALLKYCHELTFIENDISRSLEKLHLEEFLDGTLNKEYKFKRIFLGSAYLYHNLAVATHTAVQIATLTCPLLTELDILVSDNQVICTLSEFQHLESLLVQWEPINPGDFRLGVLLLLEKIGTKLRTLNILNFDRIDFCAIATLCPNLELLKVEYNQEAKGYENPNHCFHNLETLHLECFSNHDTSGDTLLVILSGCLELTSLYLHGMFLLNDSLLKAVLEKNSLSKVKEATLLECSVDEEGLRNFVAHCQALEYLHFSSSLLSFEIAVSIVHDINPHIIMRSDE